LASMKRSSNDTLKTKAKPTKGKTTYRCFESVNTPTVRSWEVYYVCRRRDECGAPAADGRSG
jgi:hypothetical protein